MSDEKIYRIESSDKREKMAQVWEMVGKGLQAGPVELVLRRPGRSSDSNAKYHAMIADIHRQAFRAFSYDGVKAVLVQQFANEMADAGTPLANPGERVWDWKTKEPVYVRPTTTKFRKTEASAFIEFLHATGVELGIEWSEKAAAEYEAYREAQK